MSKVFENKIAVVTGAGGTLCSEIAIQLALEGVKVFLVGRTAEKLEKTAEKINALGGTSTEIYACDVTDKEAIAELAKVVAAAGGCDYLINGAGGNNVKAMPTITKYDPRELTGQLPEGQWAFTISIWMPSAVCWISTPWVLSFPPWSLQSR